MPQLDINTFSNQYLGIIFVFVFVYFLLGYAILPMTLRLIMFRSKFLESNQMLDSSLSVIDSSYKERLILSTYLPNYLNLNLNSLLRRSVAYSVRLVRLSVSLSITPKFLFLADILFKSRISLLTVNSYLMFLLVHYDLIDNIE